MSTKRKAELDTEQTIHVQKKEKRKETAEREREEMAVGGVEPVDGSDSPDSFFPFPSLLMQLILLHRPQTHPSLPPPLCLTLCVLT